MTMIEKSGCVGLVFRSDAARVGATSPAPTAYVVLNYSLKDEDGKIKVTSEAQSLEELQRVVGSLKGDLDTILEQAEQRYAMYARENR